MLPVIMTIVMIFTCAHVVMPDVTSGFSRTLVPLIMSHNSLIMELRCSLPASCLSGVCELCV